MRIPYLPLPCASTESRALAKRVQKVLKTNEDETTKLAYDLDKEKDSEEYLELLAALSDYNENESALKEFLESTSEPPFPLKKLSAPGTKSRPKQIAKYRRKAVDFSGSQKRFALFIKVQALRELAEEDNEGDIPASTKIIGRPHRERIETDHKNCWVPHPIIRPTLSVGSCSFASSPSERLKELLPIRTKVFIE